MKWNEVGRLAKAMVASAALGLGMTACGGGTIGYMWVLGQSSTAGTAYQIAGFKIDNNTGNLTRIPGSPFASGGTNPVQVVVRPGGRYVYVVNAGDSKTPGTVSSYSVGGDGTLIPQIVYNTLGNTPVWAAADSSGSFLYVLDRVSSAPAGSPYFGLGAINLYSIASDTGRLSLVTNSQVRDPVTNVNLNYFPVGLNPSMFQISGSCLFTLDGGDETVFPYQIASGQLNLTTSGPINTGATALSAINAGRAYVYLTELSTTAHPNGRILPFTVGTNCALNSIVGGATDNLAPAQNPVWAFTETRDGKYLYVANQSSTDGNNNNSSITVFTIEPNTGRLSPAAGATNPVPFPTGSGPVCLVEDPTNQYLYSSNSTDGTVTGFGVRQDTGGLQPLQRGSSFAALTHATRLSVSGAVN